MTKKLDLIGVGIGPFHLSLAALLSKNKNVTGHFFDQKTQFEWHPELMFADADMQTSFLKDLVTPIDPTNPHSFLNYLVQNGYFYSFMNTARKVVTRREFELYCQWVSRSLSENLSFNSAVESVDYDGDQFKVKTASGTFLSQHLSVATGLVPRIPDCARSYLGPEVFHAKSPVLKDMDLTGKRVLIVGGGQTGVEVFRNALKKKWGEARSIRLISRRQNLEPLDESPFTNEYFHPNYVKEFFPIKEDQKGPILTAQKLASDGNTPGYLEALYNELYHLQNVEKNPMDIKILPKRSLVDIKKSERGFIGCFENAFLNEREEIAADVIILSTGFVMGVPRFLEPLRDLLHLDGEGRFILNQHFDLHWKGAPKNKIYALNFSRHRHGISEPQTSLMAWRSATIINHLLNENFYQINHYAPSFVQYGKDEAHETHTDSLNSKLSQSRTGR